jgi:vitamin B12/bleomycin/antimicrobial peptide transport system ATP-binding/permease protein
MPALVFTYCNVQTCRFLQRTMGFAQLCCRNCLPVGFYVSDERTAGNTPPTLDSGAIRGFIALARPFWVSDEKWIARGTLALAVSLSLSLIFVSVLLNEWNNAFFNAIERRDYDAFRYLSLTFLLLAMLYVTVAANQNYFVQGLEIRWRRSLSREFVGRWLGHQTYYHLQLQNAESDNPDQRIAEDLRLFAGLTLSLGMGFLSSAVTVVSFTAILWRLSGVIEIPVGDSTVRLHGYLVWAAVLYSVLGTWATHRIGKPLVKLNFAQQSFEANFRFSLVRVRENADGVAFYRGEDNVKSALDVRFQAIYDNWRRIMRRQKKIAWLTIAYGQSAAVLPLLLAAPRFLSGAISLGGLTQSAAAFIQIQGALSWFVNIYGNYAEWRATLDRLRDFMRALDQYSVAANQGNINLLEGAANELRVDGLLLEFPDGRPMLQCDSLYLKQGETVLLMGASGSGKSTLLRAIAGLWPYGHGHIVTPPESSMLFIPQRPYLPQRPMRQLITYPARTDELDSARVYEALTACGLAHLVPQLDEEQNWGLTLSLGEQQRVGFVRAILLQPKWLFLDESTSALDTDSETHLYALLKQRLRGTAIFTISHRSALANVHQRLLQTRRAGPVWILEASGETATAREKTLAGA